MTPNEEFARMSERLKARSDWGSAVDLDGIAEEFERLGTVVEAGLSDERLQAMWCEAVLDRLKVAFFGKLRIYRGLDVEDADAFLASVEAGEPLGTHWTTDIECATAAHDPSREAGRAEIVLVAETTAGSIDWEATMKANMAHPWELEVTLSGPVELHRVLAHGREILLVGLVLETAEGRGVPPPAGRGP